MRIVFMGTPDFSVPVLQALVDAGHDVAAAYTQPARRKGRGRAVTPSPVQARAEALGIAVRTPVSLRDAATQAEFAAFGADVAVVAAYGLILPRAVLDAPALGCLNVHASLLPRWRGAAPIQRAILAGDKDTGVGIMQMEAGLDTGPVRLEGRTWIGIRSAGEVSDALSGIGARLMVKVLADPVRYPAVPQPDDGVTYAPKIDKSEAKLDFSCSAVDLERKVRAFNPAPGAWFEIAGERIRILRAVALDRWPGTDVAPGTILDMIDAESTYGKPNKRRESFVIACAEGYLKPSCLQRAGKPAMAASAFTPGFLRHFGDMIE